VTKTEVVSKLALLTRLLDQAKTKEAQERKRLAEESVAAAGALEGEFRRLCELIHRGTGTATEDISADLKRIRLEGHTYTVKWYFGTIIEITWEPPHQQQQGKA
jgi:hypothetical protein